MSVPFIILILQRGGCLTKKFFVPENERHRPSWLCVACFSRIPNITVAVDTAGSVTINVNAVTGKYEASVMVLEGDRIRVVAPV